MRLNTTHTISDERVLLDSEHTLFIDVRRIKPIDLNDFNSRAKELKKRCRESKTRFGQKGIKFFQENHAAYLEEVREYDRLFFELQTKVRGIVGRGVSSPTVEDVELKEAAAIQNKMNSFFFGGRIVSKMNRINNSLLNFLYKDLSQHDKINIPAPSN